MSHTDDIDIEPLIDLGPVIDPQFRDVLASLPPIIDASKDPVGAREFRDRRFAALAADDNQPAHIDQVDRMIEIEGRELLVRVYSDNRKTQVEPAVLWFHGGGFSGGSVRFEDEICRRLVEEAGAKVVSVEYRLLPDHPYPAAIEDGYAALGWVNEHAGDLAIDPARIAVAGLSAGATLAAGLALLARDQGEYPLAYQLLLYGSYDERLCLPSTYRYRDPRSPNRDIAANIWADYLGKFASDAPAYAVPLRAQSLADLPPAYILVGTAEIVRDENIAYAQALLQAGNLTELRVIPGAFHGFDVLVPDAPISRRARAEFIAALRRGLHGE